MAQISNHMTQNGGCATDRQYQNYKQTRDFNSAGVQLEPQERLP